MHSLVPSRSDCGLVLTSVYWEYSPTDEEQTEVTAWVAETDCPDLEFLAIEQTGNITRDLTFALAQLRHEIHR